LEAFANQLVPGLADEPAWPSLRAHLLLLAVDGADPQQPLRAAYHAKEVGSADDRAAVLDWRLHKTSLPSREAPLPWLPGIPGRIAANPQWGPYLHARSQLVAEFADQVRSNAEGDAPAWAQRHAHMPTELIADMHVWRAANQIDPDDLRPTGPTQHGRAAQAWQQRLDKRLAAADTRTEWRWRQLLAAEAPTTTADSFLPQLTERLSNLTPAGFDATLLVRSAAAAGPLPDDHPAAALWWRILDQLPRKCRTRALQSPTRPSEQEHSHEVTRPRATQAELGAASRIRPKPLKTSP